MKNMIDSNRLKPIAITIWSEAFKTGDTIPIEYTYDGRNMSPPLLWTGIPSNTRSITIIMEDPDAPRGTFTHWIIYNIYPHIRGLPAFMPRTPDLAVWPLIGNGFQGITSFGIIGYGGPCPPRGETHRYVFKIYALDIRLPLEPEVSRADIMREINGHILAIGELVGIYGR